MLALALILAFVSPKLEARCVDGSATACNRIGWSYWHGLNGYPIDIEKAPPYFDSACELGYVKACNNLGWAYFRGHGVKRDYRAARVAFEAGCHDLKGGNIEAKACVNLAHMHQRGRGGLERSRDQALRFYRIGCENEAFRGCWRVATLTRDKSEKAEMLKRACDGGVEQACESQD